jgi:hypothetical protein
MYVRHWIVVSTEGNKLQGGGPPRREATGKVETTKIVLEETKNDEDDVRGFVDDD